MPIPKKQLESGIAIVESLQGTYLMFASSTQDPRAKKIFQSMADDVTKHLLQLNRQLDGMNYSQWISTQEPKASLRRALYAFVGGGLVCLFGELVTDLWEAILGISHKEAADPTVVTLIFLTALFTGLGWFDKAAKPFGAGLAVPVTGFANTLTSSALEFKREGLVFGLGGRILLMAGPVIVYGTVTAFFVGLLRALVRLFAR